MKTIDFSNYLEVLGGLRKPWHAKYFALYSSVLGGIVTDPLLMQIPIDDHLVHRGDGVFDTFRCANRAAYDLDAHVQRLMRSAAAIDLIWPGGAADLRQKILGTLSGAGRDTCFARVMIARGPGSLGVNPYDAPEPALYIVLYAAGEPFMSQHPEGARVRRSTVPVKPPQYATVKLCNYLPNVQMKREAVDWGVDFVVSFDERGHMAEGATENFGVVTQAGELLFPRLESVLCGTTMMRVTRLAEELVAAGRLKGVAFRDITEDEVRQAAEVLIVGTTVNVVSVREYEGSQIGEGQPGPVGLALDALLARDVAANDALRTCY